MKYDVINCYFKKKLLMFARLNIQDQRKAKNNKKFSRQIKFDFIYS